MSTASRAIKRIPTLIYGTAWKHDRSQRLVQQAITSGFRAVDTAAQPKHYAEDLVAAGVRDALNQLKISRDELWLQTKFTPVHGQDPSRLPYDLNQSIREQVKTSVASSLNNFKSQHVFESSDAKTEPYLDAVILHSPYEDPDQTLEAWTELTTYVPNQIRMLGASNIDFDQLQSLYESTSTKPSIVQNSFHAENGYDARVRAFCREKGIIYQAFWTLTANPHLLQSDTMGVLSQEADVSLEVALYGLIGLGLDVRVLNGTTNQQRMVDDLAGLDKIRSWRGDNRNEWMRLVSNFKGSLSRGRIL